MGEHLATNKHSNCWGAGLKIKDGQATIPLFILNVFFIFGPLITFLPSLRGGSLFSTLATVKIFLMAICSFVLGQNAQPFNLACQFWQLLTFKMFLALGLVNFVTETHYCELDRHGFHTSDSWLNTVMNIYSLSFPHTCTLIPSDSITFITTQDTIIFECIIWAICLVLIKLLNAVISQLAKSSHVSSDIIESMSALNAFNYDCSAYKAAVNWVSWAFILWSFLLSYIVFLYLIKMC